MQPSPHNAPRRVETAERHLVKRVPKAGLDETVETVLAGLPGNTFDYAGAVYVLNARGQVSGLVPVACLLAAKPRQIMRDITRRDFPVVLPDTDQEQVASLAIIHGLTAIPVVDNRRHLLGVVPPGTLFEVLRQEHVEDLHKFVGIRHQTMQARHAMEAPPMSRAWDRLPWLLVGLMGSMLATWVVAGFEEALKSRVAIAFFVPAIVYLADAVGTQTEAIAVRGLSLSHQPIGKLIGGELRTGLLIGLILGLLALPLNWFVFGDLRLALAVSLSLVVAGTAASTIGLGFPWLLSRMGKDPAFGSGPIATIVQDVLSLLIYFFIVTMLVL